MKNTLIARVFWLAVALPFTVSAVAVTQHPTARRPLAQTPPGAAIASGHRLATQAGLRILQMGGNAFDAAVAVSATLAVVEPISSGLGGGGFFLLHDGKTGRDSVLDARETAPRAATPARYLNARGELDFDLSQNGPSAAGIPGLPAALVDLARRYGRLPLAQTLAPAIRIANAGFPVYQRMADGYQARRAVMERFPATRAIYLRNGRPIAVGDRFVQPELAQTLMRLAKEGHAGFYQGETAKRLLAAVQQSGVPWSADELAAYRVTYRKPVVVHYHDWKIVAPPPPSSGGIALAEMLQIVAGWDLRQLDPVHRTHVIVEAMRRAFRDRTFYLGDPRFVAVPQRLLTSKAYAVGLRAGIHPDKATPSTLLSGQPTPLEDDETTHFSIIDQQGNSVSATQSVNLLYGSGMVVPGTGVLLNDEMDDFALKPGSPNASGVMGYAANAPQPGKRMLSSMTPVLMESPDRLIALGTPGSSRIITMVLLAILGYDAGLRAQQVCALPRYHHQWMPDVIQVESTTLPPDVAKGLENMGHTIEVAGNTAVGGRGSSHVWGNMQTVAWNRRTQTLDVGSDPRNPVGAAEILLSLPPRTPRHDRHPVPARAATRSPPPATAADVLRPSE